MNTAEHNRGRREASLAAVRERLDKAQIMVITDYRGEGKGLTVKAVSELRGKLREQNSEYLVAKNTLIRKALHEKGVEDADKYLEGPTGVAFGYGDPVSAPKVVLEFAKTQKPDNLPIAKAAVMDGRLVELEELKYLATLPNLDGLRQQLLGLMNAPAQQLVTVLDAWNKKREEEGQEA
ncbi:MAG: 50S ribosomal protein L10 [bacterium]|nr:50S ribosomal protein L10 [bacterium]